MLYVTHFFKICKINYPIILTAANGNVLNIFGMRDLFIFDYGKENVKFYSHIICFP